MKKKKKYICLSLIIILLIGLVSYTYVNDYYHADTQAFQALQNTETVAVHELKDHTLVFEPKKATAGLIFYPGGKVEYTAYAPLLHSLAEEGILCVLVEMPFNLAVLDVNAADGITELYPEVENWYIGGHSLGGSMAASYLEKHPDDYEGLILLGAYSASDLSDTDLDVISIYGSNDQVLNHEKYETNKNNLPENFNETVIEGGCHAYFGTYGHQEGDGTATITNKEQIEITTDLLSDYMES